MRPLLFALGATALLAGVPLSAVRAAETTSLAPIAGGVVLAMALLSTLAAGRLAASVYTCGGLAALAAFGPLAPHPAAFLVAGALLVAPRAMRAPSLPIAGLAIGVGAAGFAAAEHVLGMYSSASFAPAAASHVVAAVLLVAPFVLPVDDAIGAALRGHARVARGARRSSLIRALLLWERRHELDEMPEATRAAMRGAFEHLSRRATMASVDEVARRARALARAHRAALAVLRARGAIEGETLDLAHADDELRSELHALEETAAVFQPPEPKPEPEPETPPTLADPLEAPLQ